MTTTVSELLECKIPVEKALELLLRNAVRWQDKEEAFLQEWEAGEAIGSYGDIKRHDIQVAQARVDAIRECLDVVRNGGIYYD